MKTFKDLLVKIEEYLKHRGYLLDANISKFNPCIDFYFSKKFEDEFNFNEMKRANELIEQMELWGFTSKTPIVKSIVKTV